MQDAIFLIIAGTGLILTTLIILFTAGYFHKEDKSITTTDEKVELWKQKRMEKLRKRKNYRKKQEADDVVEIEEEKEYGQIEQDQNNDEEADVVPELRLRNIRRETKRREREELHQQEMARREELRRRDEIKEEAYRKRRAFEAKLEKEFDLKEESKKREFEKQKDQVDSWNNMYSTKKTTVAERTEKSKESRDAVEEFVKLHKTIHVDQISMALELSILDVQSSITELQETNAIIPITKQRDRYIYLSEVEIDQIVTLISQHGRISLASIAKVLDFPGM
ncbi:unnamed protein product [Albugo candida]|uniref:DDRGK domain-containing protein 1 n=1 Tax=Albugo candida TaxID=65357 RepID=A0A024GCI0_9STRA|nr:unnamed protein product [Albugo candida]|eukprot:CCI44461.1 unnamed protein product [Albugo candida]